MITLELFAGTKSFSKVAKKLGHETFTVDIDPIFECDYTADILNIDINKLPQNPDIIWASPPCEGFSVASIGHHWNKDNTPKTDKAILSVNMVQKTLEIIEKLKPKYFIIENPRGKLRKLDIIKIDPKTVMYCQYGDNRMKPTDIWTNIDFIPKTCKKGSPCHISAPRGSKTGTQGIKTYEQRSVVPEQLIIEILEAIK